MRQIPKGNKDVEVILFSGHRGRTFVIFRNRFHRQKLLAMGLRPETTFSCLFHYLFKLHPDACDFSCSEIRNSLSLLGKQNVLRIAIQVRMKDSVFANESSVSIDYAAAHFLCAEQITKYLPKSQRWSYVFISNSLRLRQLAKEKFGSSLLTDTTTKPLHTDCEVQGNCSRSAVKQALHRAASDLMLLSMADVHVVSARSGFGVLGAMMKPGRLHYIFKIDEYRPRHKQDHCSLENADVLDVVAESWSGF